MKFLQPSLSSGEISPGLRGRVDMARYATSLGLAKNFVTKPTGGGAKRPGKYFRGRVKFMDKLTHIVPFVYSTEVKYLIEMGDQYIRFWVGGVLLTNAEKVITGVTAANPPVVTSAAHGYVDGDQVIIRGLTGGMSRLNGRSYTINQLTGNTFELLGANTTGLAYVSGGTAGRIVEVATPHTEALLRQCHFTQSADILYIFHGEVPTKELRRTAANVFELVDYTFKRGPFRGFNTDEAAILTTSGTQGIVTVTTNVDTFNADMVGSLIYAEEKELRGVKPWASAEKNVPLGALRRSDSKVYRASSIPSSLGSKGTPYYVAGGVRPIHDTGRAFDGPQDIKDDGVNSYAVGVEWEFVHNTFGILKITAYTDARTVTAEVVERLPDSIVGLLPAPAGTWTFNGVAAQVVYPIVGATSFNKLDYQVTINGAPVQSNPNYSGGGGVGGGGGGNPRPGSPVADVPLS